MNNKCMKQGCSEDARQADLEQREWYPEDPRRQRVLCEYHRTVAGTHEDVPDLKPCKSKDCLRQVNIKCAFCKHDLCSKHCPVIFEGTDVRACRECRDRYVYIRHMEWTLKKLDEPTDFSFTYYDTPETHGER